MVMEWSDQDQAYIASFPEWEAAGHMGHTHGNSYTEAMQKGKEMLCFLIESMQAEGDVLPPPRTFAATG